MKISELGEFGFIARQSPRLARRNGTLLGIGDDAAILDSLAQPVVTCDALIEGVHFRRDWISRWSTPRALGRKAMNVSVSDLAAMGATPVAAFVTIALNAEFAAEENSMEWIDEFYAGMEDSARTFNFTIAGGDTSRALHDIFISVTMIGESISSPIRRDGARPGDVLLVTGKLGESAAGLLLLQNPETEVASATRDYLLQRHFNPTPRLREMQAALKTASIHAALDLSDGLAGDASHIARASNVDIEIETALLPISAQLLGAAGTELENAAQRLALTGGEDYELLLAVAPENVEAITRAIEDATSTPVTDIGRCVARAENSEPQNPVTVIYPDGRRETTFSAWTHF